MQALPPPQWTALETYTVCISRVRNADLRARLQNITNDIEGASDAFDQAAEQQRLHEVVRRNEVGLVTRAELEAVYVGRMAKKDAPGRAIYESLIAAPMHGRCPLCCQRLVTTLDHHLPKAHYPDLAVAPLNLVPSCSDCNKAKLAGFPQLAADVCLHPYYDNVDEHRWLFAEVVQTQPASLRFAVNPPHQFDALLQERLLNHFQRLRLGRLYSAQAAEELLNIRFLLRMIFDADGSDGVRDHLTDERVVVWQRASTDGARLHTTLGQQAIGFATADSTTRVDHLHQPHSS